MATRSRLILYPGAMDFLLNNPNGDVGRHLARKGRMVEGAAKRQVGVKTGRLRSSIHMRHLLDSRGQYVRIGSELNYALMHHEGTKPHVITPDKSKMLKFTTRGKLVYAYSVMHPGTKANKYLSDNLRLIG
jgi:hypothetical protein